MKLTWTPPRHPKMEEQSTRFSQNGQPWYPTLLLGHLFQGGQLPGRFLLLYEARALSRNLPGDSSGV